MNAVAEPPVVTQARSGPGRSLWVLIAGVGLLLAAGIAVAVLVSRHDTAVHYPPNSPQGTVQRYLGLLQSGQVDRAYDMINTDRSRSEYDTEYGNWGDRSHRVTLLSSQVTGNSATVKVDISTFDAGPFGSSSNSDRETFALSRQGHRWLINSPEYLPY